MLTKYLPLFLVLSQVLAEQRSFSVVSDEKGGYSVVDGAPDASSPWAAFVKYTDSDETKSNFGHLHVETRPGVQDGDQAYAAGFGEGFVTAERINQHYRNMLCQVDCDGNIPSEVTEFFDQQDKWVRQQVAEHASEDSYWNFVGLLVAQYDGLAAGYAASEYVASDPTTNSLDSFAFSMINAIGDLFDIMPAVAPDAAPGVTDRSSSSAKRPNFYRPQFDNMTYSELQQYMTRTGHCSALLKLTNDMSDVFMGHSSWFTYSAMLRIYKTYRFNLSPASAAFANTTSFSSYPGTLSSLDDFYINQESKLMMTQTTNNIFDSSLWDLITPESLYAWQRVRTANQMANTGPQWSDLVARYNSGTYNNQYMVLDGKLFKPGNALQSNTLYVVEQIPGLVVGGDATNELEKGYWSSYNVPYHKEIYDKSGYLSVDAKGEVWPYTQYQQAPRAKIFRQEQGVVQDLAGMHTLMRQNEYNRDPLVMADNDPWSAICARGDLSESSPYAGGGYDSKVTSWAMAYNSNAGSLAEEGTGSGLASIVNGPTAQHQPAFVWSTSGLDTPQNVHLGQPDKFDFEFEFIWVPRAVAEEKA